MLLSKNSSEHRDASLKCRDGLHLIFNVHFGHDSYYVNFGDTGKISVLSFDCVAHPISNSTSSFGSSFSPHHPSFSTSTSPSSFSCSSSSSSIVSYSFSFFSSHCSLLHPVLILYIPLSSCSCFFSLPDSLSAPLCRCRLKKLC